MQGNIKRYGPGRQLPQAELQTAVVFTATHTAGQTNVAAAGDGGVNDINWDATINKVLAFSDGTNEVTLAGGIHMITVTADMSAPTSRVTVGLKVTHADNGGTPKQVFLGNVCYLRGASVGYWDGGSTVSFFIHAQIGDKIITELVQRGTGLSVLNVEAALGTFSITKLYTY